MVKSTIFIMITSIILIIIIILIILSKKYIIVPLSVNYISNYISLVELLI